MKINLTKTEKLMQKIIDRQAELAVLSEDIQKIKHKKENKLDYTLWEQFENKINVFKLSKAG